MKKTLSFWIVICATLLVPTMSLRAEDATKEIKKVYQDPSNFDGGPGSTLNEPHATAPDTNVPPVGEPKVVGSSDAASDYNVDSSSGTASDFSISDSSGTSTNQNTEE